jgi:hypothetical protein
MLAGLFVAGLAVLLAPTVADAVAIAIGPNRPGKNRVAVTDAIVLGRVTAQEDTDVLVPVAPGQDQKVKYRIAIVTVTEIIKGQKELKKIRVGFTPVGDGGVGPGGPGPVIRPGLGVAVQLQTGQEGLFFLTKHPVGEFFVVGNQFDFVSDQAKAQFEQEVKDAKHCVELLDSPMDGLKSKDAKDRYLTAALLITKYRTARTPGAKTEKVSVEESKLILEALAEADWKVQGMPGGGPGGPGGGIKKLPPPRGVVDPMAPQQMFAMLGVTNKDGFTPPAKITSPDDYPNACKDWCRKSAGTYQIQRYVEPAK